MIQIFFSTSNFFVNCRKNKLPRHCGERNKLTCEILLGEREEIRTTFFGWWQKTDISSQYTIEFLFSRWPKDLPLKPVINYLHLDVCYKTQSKRSLDATNDMINRSWLFLQQSSFFRFVEYYFLKCTELIVQLDEEAQKQTM